MDFKEEIEKIKELLKGQPEVVGQFHKVSLAQFILDFKQEEQAATDFEIAQIYKEILSLPVRSSAGSAGHDFVLTKDIALNPGESALIHTGIRAEMKPGWVLLVAPRSGLGSKFRMQIDNTVGIIDEDYFGADNEGHIMIKVTNDGKYGKVLALKAGDRFAQGIFIPYGITKDDVPIGKRTGGHGSSGLR